MRKTGVFLGVVGLAVMFAGCMHGRQSHTVIGYRHDTVFIKKDRSYRVGALPSGWKAMKTFAKAIAFHNKETGATISTDAFCAGAFEDLPLRTLTGQLFAGTAMRKIVSENELMLDGRGALRTISTGEVDGVPLKFDSVVLKKNDCTIDFVYISPPERYSDGVSDFEAFFGGFRF